MSLHRTGLAGPAFVAIASALALSSISGPGSMPAHAQAPKSEPKASGDAKPDTRAQAILGEVAKAYKGLASYSDQGQFVLDLSVDGKPQKRSEPLKLSFARPNKLNVVTGAVQVVSDGKTYVTSVLPLKKYTQVPAPKGFNFDTFREGPLGSILFGGPSAGPMFVLVNLLTSENAVAELDKLGGTLKLVDGTDPKKTAILVDKPDGADFRLIVDTTTHLISAIDIVVDPADLAKNLKEGQHIKIERFGWVAGSVSTQPLKDDAFAFVSPKDFSKVDSFQAGGGDDAKEKYAVDEKVGKPAPNFTFTVLDGPGKTKTLTKADLAGKVVLIDFWATWCPPCMKEMPEVQKLAESYSKAKKDVVVVALSQDDEAKDLVELRKLIEQTLTEKKIEMTSLIGMDPTKSVGQAFDIEGLPTVVILDGKGIVQAAHVGFNPQVRETLAKDIDALLAGKSLISDKKPAADTGKK